MSLLTRLGQILEEGRILWEDTQAPTSFDVDIYDRYEGIGENAHNSQINKLIQGDNLKMCKYLSEIGYEGKLKMIYVDPPFFSKADYKAEVKLKLSQDASMPVIRQKAYGDSWEHGMDEYLTMLTARLFAFKELMQENGSIWVHLDWHAVHYVKVIMDEIFGEENFVNEVIWHYKSGGAGKRRYSRKHDTLLFYSKSKNYYFKSHKEKSYNREFKPYRFKGVKEYKDDTGWYTLVNMKDVWQIDMVGRTSGERTGYATQKPEALLQRIIESCTEAGDLCADFFGGSGTMAAVAEKTGRQWISCDTGKLSTLSSLKRMLINQSSFELIEAWETDTSPIDHEGGIDISVDIKQIPASGNEHRTVKLLNYKLWDDARIPIEKKDLPYIKNIAGKDRLQLIDYFAVDFDYDGKIFRPDIYSSKINEYINPQVENLGKKSSSIAVKAVDIFGNTSLKII